MTIGKGKTIYCIYEIEFHSGLSAEINPGTFVLLKAV
jgi:hypothetical protein